MCGGSKFSTFHIPPSTFFLYFCNMITKEYADGLQTLQHRMLKILTEVDRVCRAHDIRCYLCDGTMLGAVRHGGFIPWDDDADVCMPRPDYERFMQHASEWLPKPLEARCYETDSTYPGAFGKVIDASTTLVEREHYAYVGGVYIDVFPIDGMPEGRSAQRMQLWKYKLYNRLIYLLHRNPYKHGHGVSSWLPLLVRRLFRHKSIQHALRKSMLKYDFDQCDLCVNYDDGWRGIMSKTCYGKPTPVLFEGQELMGVEQAKQYLTNTYGDYMTIPPHEDQRQHNFYYLDYDHSYHDYDDPRPFVKQIPH